LGELAVNVGTVKRWWGTDSQVPLVQMGSEEGDLRLVFSLISLTPVSFLLKGFSTTLVMQSGEAI